MRRRSLHLALVVRYTLFFVIGLVAILGILFSFLAHFVEDLSGDAAMDAAAPVVFEGDYTSGTLRVARLPASVVWVDFLKDGEVVQTHGDRQVDAERFDVEEVNRLLQSEFHGRSRWGYDVQVVLYPVAADAADVALLFTPFETGVQMGINVPEELKGTAFEASINQKLQMAYATILIILVLVILFFSVMTYRMIVRPIRKLNAGLLAVKCGELDARITYKGYGELMELTQSFNDMTQRLECAEREAAELSESKKQLVLHLSHDLRSPSTVVKGYAAALSEGVVPEAKKAQYYQYILDKSTLIVDRLEQLFAYAKLDVSHYDLNCSRLDICEFLRRLVISYLPEAERAGLELVFEVPEVPVWVNGDRVELERAVGNLVENAVKYAGEGATVEIALTAETGGCTLRIEDDGIGIAPEACDAIFTPFVRGDETRKMQGTGLGLPITRQIIQLHGGTVVCVPQERGTRFVVAMPTV